MANSVADAREIHAAAEAAGVKRRVRVPRARHPRRSSRRSDPADLISAVLLRSAGPRRFVDAILADEAPTPSFLDGLRAQEMIDAAARSSAESRWIGLS